MPERLVINPDVRFGTSYLSIEHETASVESEVLMDKIDGEIFIKRPLDGKVISFSQNNKFLYETIMELKILLKNYSNIKYPLTSGSYFTSTDYIMRYLMTGDRKEILAGDNLEFSPSSQDASKRFEFYVSKESNGFFCMIKPRLIDKTFIEYLTTEYNILCKDYADSDPDILAEKEKFKEDEYETSNATISYTITIKGIDLTGNVKTVSLDSTYHVTMGKESMVPFPSSYNSTLSEILEIVVNINAITFDKLRFIDNYIATHDTFDKSTYNKLIAPDNRISINTVNIFSFVDDASQIQTEDSRQVIVAMSSSGLHDYIGTLDKLSGGSGFIVSNTRPLDSLWTVNNVWAETIRVVRPGGIVVDTDHETDIDLLESLIYDSNKPTSIATGFTLDKTQAALMFIGRLEQGEEEG